MGAACSTAIDSPDMPANDLASDHPSISTPATATPAPVLVTAIKNGDDDLVKTFCNSGIGLDEYYQGQIPIYLAAVSDNAVAISALLEAGANGNLAASNGWTPLHIASYHGYVDVVKVLIPFVDLNTRNQHGSTALYLASQQGQLGVVRALIRANADPNVICADGATALFIAAQEGRVSVTKILLNAGAKPNVVTTDGSTPLAMAKARGDHEIGEMLMVALKKQS